MSAEIVQLPWPQFAEAPSFFRARFDDWKRTRAPVESNLGYRAPNGERVNIIDTGRIDDPIQMSLDLTPLPAGKEDQCA